MQTLRKVPLTADDSIRSLTLSESVRIPKREKKFLGAVAINIQ